MTEILNEVIASYNDYIKKIPTGCQKIADDLRDNQVNDSLNSIIDFTDGVRWLSEASGLLRKNGLTVDLNIDKINGFLKEINHGLEIQDYVLVSDMFEYEIQPFFEECQAVKISELQ
ncbi:hypothetical protein ACIQYS_06120 [Psychrobacillus sp. NPDC096426]|uniref:hypothetical protein n=1 Tax=Psychrobacillus sp. NPDC096426 TaxID=3364491 RepID=UPI00382FBA75